jgi:FkbM family methyltransferase
VVDPKAGGGVEIDLFLYGSYEEGTLRALNHILRLGDTFVDIGANVGLMSLHAAKIVGAGGRVVSFEPLPSAYSLLLESIKINGLSNVLAENIAIGSAAGRAAIREDESNRGSSQLSHLPRVESDHKVQVERLDDYLARQRMHGSISCIKVDVEGWELEVLKGARQTLSGPTAPVCIVEYSTSRTTYGGDAQDIFQFLRDVNSYRVFRLAWGKDRPSKMIEIKSTAELPKHDNLFCFLPGHLNHIPHEVFD